MRAVAAAWMACAALAAGAQEHPSTEAVTTSGDKVRLYPNGRWEYVDVGKAAAARKIAEQFPENRVRPAEAQGGWFGIGRTVMPGDADYNRGSLNPKMR